jgi:hypothetical protein
MAMMAMAAAETILERPVIPVIQIPMEQIPARPEQAQATVKKEQMQAKVQARMAPVKVLVRMEPVKAQARVQAQAKKAMKV